MSRDIEATISQLKELLPYVARDAGRYRNATELVRNSRELARAAEAIDETLPWPSLASSAKGPIIRIRIGTNAVEAFGFRKLPYDFLESEFEMAEPGEEYNLLYKKRISTEPFSYTDSQPVYGQMKYFDLATIGRILENGGDIFPSEPGSSSSK
ncbi:MAG: hypothetical protein ABIR46_04050 [Candidatus Saccharimonadales bacterium]